MIRLLTNKFKARKAKKVVKVERNIEFFQAYTVVHTAGLVRQY